MCHTSCQPMVFQSTLPVWGGTISGGGVMESLGISIHPPRVGRDMNELNQYGILSGFQSTLPVWGGTGGKILAGTRMDISIHPPRVGRDILRLSRPEAG